MPNIWAKVRCFLDMMDIQDSYCSQPSTYTSLSSLSCSSSLHPLLLGAERWQVGEKTTKHILSVIQPTTDSEKRRREIIEYLQTLIEDSFGIKVFPFGSVPLKTYLPHGDVDLTVVSHYDTGQDLASDIHNLLQMEMTINTEIQVRDVVYVPAQVKIVKCTVSNIAVDISFNQTAGLSALCFLDQVDQFIGKDHLFKRSVILIKAWCYYESRLLGGYHGLISTYALETLVLHVINNFHCSLHCPLAVLHKFLEYYSTFDWERYCVAINGRVSISCLPDIAVQHPYDSDELLLTDEFLRPFREAFLSSAAAGGFGTKASAFPVKFLNIFDPLRDDNNLGRSVSKGNFYRIRSALSYGTEKLNDILMLPPAKIAGALETFFVNTLERNGRGRRADLLVPVPAYGAGWSETLSSIEDSDDLLTGIEYDLWFNGYGILSPIQLNPFATQVWSDEWVEMGQNMPFDQNIYYDVYGSPPSSVDSPLSLQLTNAVSEEEKEKFRGTGLCIPHLEPLIQSHIGLGGDGKEEEAKKEQSEETKPVDSQVSTSKGELLPDEGSSSCMVDFSLEEFPLLPGSKPLPIKVSQSESPKFEDVNDAFASESSLGLGSFKCLSSRSVALSEVGKLSDSDVPAILDPPNEPAIVVGDKQEPSKSEEKPYEISWICDLSLPFH
uniref:Polynucleotide adenylyltransferase n=1 Tax=Opuntia streptacantha TaxID=393608 RepID=A0A7C9AQJ3_OPUST